MEIKTVRVSEKGQIAIPSFVREKVGIRKGDELVLVQSGNKIFLEKSERISGIIEDDFKDIVKIKEDSLKEVWDNKEDDVWELYLK